jgi:uncharacterized DUF497 family protein
MTLTDRDIICLRKALIVYILNTRFEWDDSKARQNQSRHGISFEAAMTAFDDPPQLRSADVVHSTPREEREILIGRMDNGVVVTIVFTQREEVYRLISARRAERKEKILYYENEKASYDRP